MTKSVQVCFVLMLCAGLAQAQSVRGTVDAGGKGEPIHPLLYGINTARWDESLFPDPTGDMLLTADRDAIAKIRNSGVTLLKYPGGNDADAYIWNSPDNSPSEMDTDEYIALCRATDAEPFITINFNASAELAADWVRYCNLERGYGVKLWEVGDEQWGTWAKGHAPPAVYAQKYVSFVRAMKAVDPTIKVATNVPLGPHPEDWTTKVLEAAADYVDILTFTYFPQKWGEENDDTLMATVDGFAKLCRALYSEVELVLGKERAEKILFVNVGYNSVNHSPGPQTLQLVNAIWTADMIGTMATIGVDIGCFWALHNAFPPRGGDYGYLSSEGMNIPSYSYHVFPMFSRHIRGRMIPASVADERVSTYASRQGRTIGLMLINKDRTASIDVSMAFTSFSPGQHPDPKAWVLDEQRKVEPLEGVTVQNGELSLTLPPFSIVVAEVISADSVLPPANRSRNATPSASSWSTIGPRFGPGSATDGLSYTRWNSAAWTKSNGIEAQWFRLDWETPVLIERAVIHWGANRAVDFTLEVSEDGKEWRTVSTVTGGKGEVDSIRFSGVPVKSIRMSGTRGTAGISAYSIREFEVY